MKKNTLQPLLKAVERCRDSWRPRIQGTILYRVLQMPSRVLRSLLPDYRDVSQDGIFFRESELWMCSLLPLKILDWLVDKLQPKAILDVGCGTGKSLDYFLGRGIDVLGVEGSTLAVSKAKHPERILIWNLENELQLGREFDLVFSYEVAEHVHPDYADNLIRTLINHSALVVMTAARPGQGGEGHLNEQPPEYWVERFSRHGYELDQQLTAGIKATGELYSENALVFRCSRRKESLTC